MSSGHGVYFLYATGLTKRRKESRVDKTKRYIVQFVSPTKYQDYYVVYDVVDKRIVDRHTNYTDAQSSCDMLNRTNDHGWEPILVQMEMELD